MTSDTPAPPPPASDRSRLRELVDIWYSACQDVIGLLEQLDDEEWARSTDLPGWDVKAVAAHLAHLESELAGIPQEQVEVPDAPHLRTPFSHYTEVGPVARRDWPHGRIVEELRSSVETRMAELRDNPPADLSETGPSFAALAGWSWETLLTNRPFDVWMHEQDIRRAVGHPGGLDNAAASHAARVFARGFPMVVGKRAQAQPGETVALEIDQAPPGAPARVVVVVDEDGRARVTEDPAPPTATVRVGFEDWVRLAGGRCTRGGAEVQLSGDVSLAARVVDGMAVTP